MEREVCVRFFFEKILCLISFMSFGGFKGNVLTFQEMLTCFCAKRRLMGLSSINSGNTGRRLS